MAENDQQGWSLFGFQIRKVPPKETVKSFTPPANDDGAVIVAAGGAYGSFVDLDGTVRTEAELVAKYREMALQPEIDKSVNEVTNESIVYEEGKETVEIILDDLPIQPNLKKIIEAEFDNILHLLDFKKNSYDIFRRWYIDGRIYYHCVIDEAAPGEGLKELRYVDPRKIRKVREVQTAKDPKTGATLQKVRREYYIFNEKGLGAKSISPSFDTTGLKISKDAVIQTTSGLMDVNNKLVLSYLHQGIKPLNQLRSLEDASLIYHLSRAPERRIFYIDVGNLPKIKAEQYMTDMMDRYKNKLKYDAATGEIRDDRKFMTFLEDYWLPRREGGKGTEITTLSGGTQLSQLLESVEYFQDKLYRALQVPLSRMKPDTVYSLGRATEITRDELNFSKFIDRLRIKFSEIFLKSLEKQLILKGIAAQEDWDEMKKFIRFNFLKDTYSSELKENEILMGRLNTLQAIEPYTGRFFSNIWVRKNVLMQSDNDIEEMDEQIAQEMETEQYNQQLFDQKYSPDEDGDNKK